ncbi:MAG: hypothetical protein ACYT04_96980 [Nostoc sp.]
MQQEWLADGSCFSQGETLREQVGKPQGRTASSTHWLGYTRLYPPFPHFSLLKIIRKKSNLD